MRRPGQPNVVTNWRQSDAARPVKLRMAARNIWTKVRRGSRCCGNPGQPGC